VTASAIRSVAKEIAFERGRQDEKWGAQNHRSFIKTVRGFPEAEARKIIAAEYGIPTEEKAKAACDQAMKDGKCTWMHILVEEVCEVGAAFKNPVALRKELIQVAAVAAAWAQAIDEGRAGGW